MLYGGTTIHIFIYDRFISYNITCYTVDKEIHDIATIYDVTVTGRLDVTARHEVTAWYDVTTKHVAPHTYMTSLIYYLK